MKRKNTGFYHKWNYESQLILFSILFIIDIQIIITYNNILLTNHFTKSHETIIYKNPQRPSSATLNPNNHQKKKKIKKDLSSHSIWQNETKQKQKMSMIIQRTVRITNSTFWLEDAWLITKTRRPKWTMAQVAPDRQGFRRSVLND